VGVQVRTQALRGETVVGRQTSALVGMLTATQAQVNQQSKEIERLRTQVAKYEKEAASERGLTRLVNEELQNSRIALGLTPVKGPGIELQLGDSTMRPPSTAGPQDIWVIHELDLITLTNELWAAGAEAMALNGQRLGPRSAIKCSGRLIQVDGVTIPSPFTFLAIGDKSRLMSALNIRGGVLDGLRLVQFQVKLTPKDEIVLPPVAIAPKYQYARPVTQEQSP